MGQLILTRKIHEEIVIRTPGIAAPVIVRIAEIRGDRVRLAFRADADVSINRPEIDAEKHPGALLL